MIAADIRGIAWNRPGRNALIGIWSRAVADLATAATWLRQARCAVGGHAMVLHFESNRLALECVGCGKQTPGWTVGR